VRSIICAPLHNTQDHKGCAMVSDTSKYAAEFLGTFLLVFTVGCNVLSGQTVFGAVSIASVLMVAIYAMGGISGANFNPAVSVSLGLVRAMGAKTVDGKANGLDWKTVGMYSVVQIVAGVAAGFMYTAFFWESINLVPKKGYGVSAGLCEILYTFMLCFVVLNVAASKNVAKNNNQFYGLAIGFVIVAGAYGAGAISGGCFNPAVAIGLDASSAESGFGWCFAYTAFELAGAALAAGLFRVIRPGDFKDEELSDPGPVAKLTSEFLGTYMLVLTVGLNVLAKSPAAAFSIAASLMSMIYALGDVSGANFNPAVSLAICLSGLAEDFDAATVAKYTGVQLLGGIAAGFTYVGIYKGQSFGIGPQGLHGWGEVFFAEVLFTFVLCFVVLTVAVSPKTSSKDMFGLSIGSCVTVGGFAIGSISGGSLNPAVSFGIEVSDILGGGMVYKALAYTVFELLGALAAAGLVRVTHQEVLEDTPEKEP